MKKFYLLLSIAWILGGALHAQNAQRRTTVWDGNQWSTGLPDAESDAIITANLTSSVNLEAYNITVSSGVTLNMTGDSRLVLFNNGIIERGGHLMIIDDAQFVQKNPAATPPSIDLYRKTGFIFKYDYTYFSSPVSGQIINGITAYSIPTDLSFAVGNYNNIGSPDGQSYLVPLADKYFTFNPSATPVGTDANWFSAGAWQNIPDTSVMDNDGKGYIVRGPNSFPQAGQGITQQWWVKFTGIPNSGTITRAINGTAYTPFAGTQTALPTPLTFPYKTCNDGLFNMNLIGNPYPSVLDADTFLTNPANVSAIDGAIYMWSHNSGPSAANPGNGTQISTPTAKQ